MKYMDHQQLIITVRSLLFCYSSFEWNDKIICQGNALRFIMSVEIKFIWIQYPIYNRNMIGHQQCHINVIIPSVLCTGHSDSDGNTISSIYSSRWNRKPTKTPLGVGKVPYLAILIVWLKIPIISIYAGTLKQLWNTLSRVFHRLVINLNNIEHNS